MAMQRTTIAYKGVDYPVRIVDLSRVPGCESGYECEQVADEQLLQALGDESTWGRLEYATDSKLYCYVEPEALAQLSDEELVDYIIKMES